MKLVKYEDNWADEMDIEGFHIVSDEAWQKFLDMVTPELFGSYSFCIGTNEEIEYEDAEDVLSAFEATDISDEDAKAIQSNLKLPYGFFPASGVLESILNGTDLEWEEWMMVFD
jgi:hypothetical protein